MKGNKALILFLSIVLIICINGCGSKSTKKVPSVPVKSDLFGKITVWSEKDDLKALQKAGEDFKKYHPDVDVQVIEVDSSKLYDKITVGLATGSDFPDVFSINNDYIPLFVSKFPDGFMDVSSSISSIKNGFYGSQITESSVNGRSYAYPWKVVPSAIFYRTDIFSSLNINPEDIKTWYDYNKAGALLLSKTDGKVKMFPMDEGSDVTLYQEMLNQLKTGYFDQDGNPALNSDNALNAMAIIKKMCDTGIIYNYSGDDSLYNAIKNGEVATLPYGCYYAQILKTIAPELSGKWGVIKFPTFEPGGNNDVSMEGSSLMITKASKNTKVATEFAKFAVTDSNSLIDSFKKYEILPAYASVLKDPIFDRNEEYFNNLKIWRLFKDIVKNSDDNHISSNLIQTKKSVVEAQKDILINKKDSQNVLDSLQLDMQSRFGK